MIGCDIVKISRLSLNLSSKILTPCELQEYQEKHNKEHYLAGRWAAKEAIFKACGIKENLSILTDADGKPYVKEDRSIEISISHDTEYAMAVAFKKG
jgi:holo-[acyl-carrier protein] synthase